MGRHSRRSDANEPEIEPMIRVLLLNAFLFALPFVATWAWMKFIAVNRPDESKKRNYAYAAIAGLVLVVVSLLSYRVMTANAPEGTYVPPSFKDGEIVPGRFE